MATLLLLESATTVCSVAVSRNGVLLALKEQSGEYAHAENLSYFVESCLQESAVGLHELDAIVISKGPGSYTGLRIGVSTAKGFCYSLNIPLIAISTLEQMAHGAISLHPEIKSETNALLCPMIDARRMEVYSALFTTDGSIQSEIAANIIDSDSFQAERHDHRLYFFGDGAEKCKISLAPSDTCVYFNDVFPSAKNMIELADKAFQEKRFEDLAYFEPFYLKEFVAGKKKASH